MQIDCENIADKVKITLTGEEEFLSSLYEAYPGSQKNLKSLIELEKFSGGEILIKGNVSYKPLVSCDLCCEEFEYSVNADIDAVARKEVIEDKKSLKETELSLRDLDSYPILGGKIDLLQVLIDAVELSIPIKISLDDKNGSCQKCQKFKGSPMSYTSKPDEKNNPFAVLKNLNLKN